MFHKILLIVVVLGFSLIGFLFSKFSQTDDTLKLYQRYGFVSSEIRYEKVEKKWGQQGLIFYQLEFPGLKVPHHREKMALSMNDNGISAHFSNINLNVNQAMQKLYASQPEQALESYAPYHDFFNRILTSLAVMGIDEFVGDMSLNTTYSDLKTIHFDVRVDQEKRPSLKISGIIHIPVIGTPQLMDLWNGQIENLDIKVQNQKYLNKYINYAKSRRIQLPESLKNGLISFKKLSRKLPKLSDIMR